MRDQPGFFAIDDRLKRLSDLGDQLEAFRVVVDFETFRPELNAALSYSNGSQGGRPPFDPVMMFKILVIQAANNLSDVRIPINSPVYSDPISPAIPISNRSPFRFQIARGKRSFRHVDFLALVTVVGQPFLVCFPLVRRMLSPARSMRWAL